jgi:L-seryl-tRNA(Ser) seleniumtransferase
MEARAKQALSAEQAELLRQIPSVDELLAQPRLADLASSVDRTMLVEVTRTVLAELRSRITDQAKFAVLSELRLIASNPASLEEHISSIVERILAHSLQPVINATGVILHTNLGRAPLSAAVVEEFRRAATQYRCARQAGCSYVLAARTAYRGRGRCRGQ